MRAQQLDFFSEIATETDWKGLLRRAIRRLTLYEPLDAILRDMVRHDADIADVAQMLKEQKQNEMYSGDRLFVHTTRDGVALMQSYRGRERKYTWIQTAKEYAAMYWEEREREEAELEAEGNDA